MLTLQDVQIQNYSEKNIETKKTDSNNYFEKSKQTLSENIKKNNIFQTIKSELINETLNLNLINDKSESIAIVSEPTSTEMIKVVNNFEESVPSTSDISDDLKDILLKHSFQNFYVKINSFDFNKMIERFRNSRKKVNFNL